MERRAKAKKFRLHFRGGIKKKPEIEAQTKEEAVKKFAKLLGLRLKDVKEILERVEEVS